MLAVLPLLADANSGGQIQQIAENFGVDWPHLIAQIVSFCIVCALLYRFAYHPVLTMLAERRTRIAESLANGKKIKAELARTEELRQETLRQANAQATRLIEEAHQAAAELQERETKKALASAEQIIANAHETAARDYDKMLTDLKHEVGRLVVQTTAMVADKVLTPEDQARLAEETVSRIAAA